MATAVRALPLSKMRPPASDRLAHSLMNSFPRIVLASGSEIRARILRNAGVIFDQRPVRVDEPAIRDALLAEAASPRDIADTLAETKALRGSSRAPDMLVLGADQILELDGRIFAKPGSKEEAAEHLAALQGRTHRLFSALVVCREGQPLWRHIGEVRLTMHPFTPRDIDTYLENAWPEISGSVGGYLLEGQGITLFSDIKGDYLAGLGLPLLPFLNWLRLQGETSR